MTKLAYSIDDAAALYDVSPAHIRRAIKAGSLAAKRVGRTYRISARALQDWFGELPDA